MNYYVVNYSIGNIDTRYEEMIKTESEAAARRYITNKFPGQIVHIWRVTRK